MSPTATVTQTATGATITATDASGIVTLDLRGFDPSTLTNISYALSYCASLTTIYVDSGWALPVSLTSYAYTFMGCSAFVGGNGTAYDSSHYDGDYLRIDTAATPGYCTAA